MKSPHTPSGKTRPKLHGAGKRRCPICDLLTDADLCPEHAMATLLVDAPSPSIANMQVGALIANRYMIQRVIGKGGYGAVFEARHTGTGQGIAIKTLAPGLEADDTALRRFFQEARVTSGLRHPNTIRVFDFGQDDTGLIYLAMELLTGLTLKQELKLRMKDDRVFSEREAVSIGIAVTKSLGEAHAAGLVHRDLKPDNIFLHRVEGDDPVVKVLDFGIVKLANSSLTLGSDSGIPGTPAYMSPEQVIKNGEIDGRSDLYSLGIVLYNLVTGGVPFKGGDVMQTLYMHVHEPAPDVRDHAKTHVSDTFADLIAQVLSKEPGERPQDARAMRNLLQSCLGESGRIMFGFEASWDSNVEVPRTLAMDNDPDQRTADTTPSVPSARGLSVSQTLRRPSGPSRDNSPMPLAESVVGSAQVPVAPPSGLKQVVMGAIIALTLVAMMLAGFLLSRMTEDKPVVISQPIPAEPVVPVTPPPEPVKSSTPPEPVKGPPPAELTPPPVETPPPVKKDVVKKPPVRRPPKDNKSDDVLNEKI